MDGSSQFNKMGISRAWTKAADARIRRLLTTGQYHRILPCIVSDLDAAELEHGFTPAIEPLIWSIHCHLRKQSALPDVGELRIACEAHHKIKRFTFQTLESDELFKSLLDKNMNSTGAIASLVWMNWIVDQGCPISAARNWIENKRCEFGLGPMFSARFMHNPKPQVNNAVTRKHA